MTEGAWRVREGQLKLSAVRDGEGGVDVAGGRRRERRMRKKDDAFVDTSSAIWAQDPFLLIRSLPPHPRMRCGGVGILEGILKVGGWAWGCLGVVLGRCREGGDVWFGVLAVVAWLFRLGFVFRGLVGERGRTFRTMAWIGPWWGVNKRGRTFCA